MNYYRVYVGSLTVQEFIAPFGNSVKKAIANVVETWPWDDKIPDDFATVINDYCWEQLAIAG